MRTLSAQALAALAAPMVPLAVLVEMDLASGNLWLNTASVDLTLSGNTYYGTKGLGSIEAMLDTPAEARGLAFELSGVPSTQIALALTEAVQGRAVRVRLAIFDPATYQVLAVDTRWTGLLDTMTISDTQPTASLRVTAEHAGIDLFRPFNSTYSDAEQQRLASGDTFFQYLTDQVDMRVVWPAAAFFRQ